MRKDDSGHCDYPQHVRNSSHGKRHNKRLRTIVNRKIKSGRHEELRSR